MEKAIVRLSIGYSLMLNKIGVFSFVVLLGFVMDDEVLQRRVNECAKEAEKTGESHREVALRRISEWRTVLRAVSDDYRGMEEEKFYRVTEMEIDSWERENREW